MNVSQEQHQRHTASLSLIVFSLLSTFFFDFVPAQTYRPPVELKLRPLCQGDPIQVQITAPDTSIGLVIMLSNSDYSDAKDSLVSNFRIENYQDNPKFAQLDWDDILVRHGYSVLRYSPPGFGNSGGRREADEERIIACLVSLQELQAYFGKRGYFLFSDLQNNTVFRFAFSALQKPKGAGYPTGIIQFGGNIMKPLQSREARRVPIAYVSDSEVLAADQALEFKLWKMEGDTLSRALNRNSDSLKSKLLTWMDAAANFQVHIKVPLASDTTKKSNSGVKPGLKSKTLGEGTRLNSPDSKGKNDSLSKNSRDTLVPKKVKKGSRIWPNQKTVSPIVK